MDCIEQFGLKSSDLLQTNIFGNRKNDLGISICFLTIYNGLISWLAREYGLYIYFGVNLNEVRDRLLHCTQRWLCTAASRGEVAPLENTIEGLRVLGNLGCPTGKERG